MAEGVAACLGVGTDAQVQGGNGYRPEYLTAGFSGDPRVLKALFETGADPMKRTVE